MNTRRSALLLLAAFAAPLAVRADELTTLLRPVAFQGGATQAAIGDETAALAAELVALAAELERNGFPPESLGGLTALAAELEKLGGGEMAALAARLRAAAQSRSTDGREVAAAVTEVYGEQQTLQSRLTRFSRQLALQQLREEAVRRLEALILRQGAAQRETRAIAGVRGSVDERLRLLVSDQGGITADLAAFLDTGETLLTRLREGVDPLVAAAVNAGAAAPSFADKVNAPQLNGYASAAGEDIVGRLYPEAFRKQQALLDELRKLLQSILSSQAPTERLSSALQQVAALKQQADTLPANNPEAAQALADQVALLATQVAPVNPEAAQALAQAQAALQPPPPTDAAAEPPPPPPPPGDALQQAQDALAEQLAQAQAQAQLQLAAGPGQGQGTTPPTPPNPDGPPQPGTEGHGEAGGPLAGSGGEGEAIAAAPGAAATADAAQEAEAMVSLQNETYPADYDAWIVQYRRNLAAER